MPAIYPRLLRRVRAALADSVVFVILFFVWFFSLDVMGSAHPALKIAPLLLGLLVFEPGLVSWSGGTIGHHLFGLRIRDSIEDRNVGFLRATLRAILRTLLGWISLIFIFVTSRHQAIHDYASHTVVVLRNPDDLPKRERFAERVLAPEGFELPSRLRRVGFVALYGALSYVGLAVLVGLLLSESCIYSNACSPADEVISASLSLVWLVTVMVIIVMGWRGQLFGCRRRQMAERSR